MKAPARAERKEHAFREAAAWSAVGAGWLPLCGKFQELGFSVEWHDFECYQPLDWSRSFHPDSLELCFNLAGSGFITDPKQQVQLAANTFSFYRQGSPPLVAQRQPGQRHKFITIEFSRLFLQRHLSGQTANLHPLVRTLLDGDSQASQVAPADRLGSTLLALIDTLRHPPVFAPAHQLWFQCKALETAAQLFFHPPGANSSVPASSARPESASSARASSFVSG
ncbi:MAG: hypothetical protein L0Y58_24005 [Verrucomicrobia subdivision 3 bacterium]|nr:hypothetical protein [Limisphaerales bacterium]